MKIINWWKRLPAGPVLLVNVKIIVTLVVLLLVYSLLKRVLGF